MPTTDHTSYQQEVFHLFKLPILKLIRFLLNVILDLLPYINQKPNKHDFHPRILQLVSSIMANYLDILLL